MSAIVTLIGQSAIADAVANGTEITFAELAVGDGDGSSVTPLETMTGLVNEVGRVSVQSVSRDEGNPNVVTIEALLDEEEGPYTIREIGVFDDDGQMLAVASYPTTEKLTTAQGVTTTLTIRVILIISDTAQVTVQMSSEAYVTASRAITTTEGIGGGGDFSTDRVHKLNLAGLDAITGGDVDGAADQLVIYDLSATQHKKITPNEAASVLGGAFANDAETIAGTITNKKTHPAGVKAAIMAALGPGGNVRSFEHASDANAPISGEWASPPNGSKAIVSNASDNSLRIWERRGGAWVSLGPLVNPPAAVIAGFWQGLGRTGSTYAASKMTWQSGNFSTSTFTLPAPLSGTAYYVVHAYASGTVYGSVATGTTTISVSNNSQDDIIVFLYTF